MIGTNYRCTIRCGYPFVECIIIHKYRTYLPKFKIVCVIDIIITFIACTKIPTTVFFSCRFFPNAASDFPSFLTNFFGNYRCHSP